MRRTGAALAAILVVGLALAGAARADHSAEMKAREDFAAGRYERALELFAKLYAETLNPVYLRNIARCHQKLHEPDKAIETFNDYLAQGRTITPEERVEIDGYIREMQAMRVQQAEEAKRAEKAKRAAAAPPPPPPPVVIQPLAPPTPPPAPATAGMLVAQPGPPPESESPPFYARWWFWTIVGAAVAGGVVAAVALSGGTTKPPCMYSGVNIYKCQ